MAPVGLQTETCLIGRTAATAAICAMLCLPAPIMAMRLASARAIISVATPLMPPVRILAKRERLNDGEHRTVMGVNQEEQRHRSMRRMRPRLGPNDALSLEHRADGVQRRTASPDRVAS